MTQSLRQLESRSIAAPVRGAVLAGDLVIPDHALGIVLFAHGSGSSRFSPRNRQVATTLQDAGFATLLLDLLTPDEEAVDEITGQLRFDIDMLALRLADVTDWIQAERDVSGLPVGYFGASTGAAAALVAAALRPKPVKAIVSRGGRPDLAGRFLDMVVAPTLLIVGGNDEPVIEMNRNAMLELRITDKELVIVPGATHLFEEPGALERVARLACGWFQKYLAPAARAAQVPAAGAV